LPEYVDAKQKIAKAEGISTAGNENRVTAKQVQDATDAAIDARMAISKMESDALRNSPEYKDAQLRLKTAQDRLAELWDKYKQSELATVPSYRAAIANKQAAEQELKYAQDEARIARQQAAAQQQASRPQRSTMPRSTGRSSSGGGSMGRRGGY
jgi:hypothetical protein